MTTRPRVMVSTDDGALCGAKVLCWNAGPACRASPQDRASSAAKACWSGPVGEKGSPEVRTVELDELEEVEENVSLRCWPAAGALVSMLRAW